MWGQTSATETHYSPLAPEVLLQRLTSRTAIVTTSDDWRSSSRWSQPFHEFEGTVSNQYFAIRRLLTESLGLRSYQFSLPAQPPEVEGWLIERPSGGTQVQLRYQAMPIKWWWMLLSLSLVAWSRGAFAFVWPTASQTGQVLAIAVLVLLASWVARPASLWLRMREIRPRLAELLSLVADSTT